MPNNYLHRMPALLWAVLIAYQAAGQCVSVQNGDWDDPDTWSCQDPLASRVPLCTDVPITIAEGHTVSISAQQTYNCGPNYDEQNDYMVIIVEGTLSFVTGNKLRLPAGSFIGGNGNILPPGNGSGNSSLIEIGDAIVWNAAAGLVEGPFQFPESHPLPVHLLSFDGRAGADAVHLSWTVASEVNNDYFAIERSPDMVTWTVVHTQPGSGNSNQVRTCRGQDASPENGLMYYRLSQTDFDGTREVFDPIAIEFRAGAGARQSPVLYPNPLDLSSQQPLFIRQEDGGLDRITFSDINGQAIQQIDYSDASSNPNKLEIDHQAFSQGMYFVRMEGAFGAKTAKLVVQ